MQRFANSISLLNIWKNAVFVALLTGTAFAQIDTGSIVGSVYDASGAAIQNATVTLTNRATDQTWTTRTNEAGEYQFNALHPGSYSVKAANPGFGAQEFTDVQVDVDARLSRDFTLQVGNITQTLEVQSTTPLLDTQTAELGGVVHEQQIVNLPLNGRRYADLALLEPGIQKNLTNTNNTAPDRFSSNGNLETQNYFSLDGVDNNSGSTNLQEGSVQAVQPPPDALQEFRVQTRTYSAEFGTSAGAIINASIKSGTNEFHGDVWEFLRNNDLDANSFFNNFGGIPRGHFSQNQFGGTFGGPILKEKTFFFVDAQGLISRKATTTTSTVPTPLMKTGNFSELKPALSDSVVPGQAGCISHNIIATSCLDPTGLKLISLFPDPNVPSAVQRQGVPGSWTGGNNYQFVYSVPNNTYSYDTRIDHAINARNRIFGRFSDYTVDRQDPPWTGNALAGNGNFATQYNIRGKSVALSWTDVLSSSAVNELRGGFSRDNAHSDPIGVQVGTSGAATYGLNGIPEGPFDAGIPPINISSLQRLGTAPWRPQVQIAQVWQLLDTLSWLRGNHSLKFGYEFRHPSDNYLDAQSLQGQITASGIYTGNTGLGVPDFLLGDVSTAAFTTPTVVHDYKIGNSFFAQDSWRARKNFTLNYGVRYELFSPLLNHQNALANFTPANGGGFVTATSGDWYQRSLIHPDKNDWAPRLGFSYQPLNRIVFRGGYGIFYQHDVRIGSESALGENPPFFFDESISQSLGSTTPAFILRNGFPASQFSPAAVSLPKLQIRAQDPNQRTSYVQQASFGPQIEFSQSTVLDISYVGNFGRKENRLRNANQGIFEGFTSPGVPFTIFPFANLNTTLTSPNGTHAFLELATNDGNTNYNGLLVSLRKRFSSGLSYEVSYTFSKNFADFVDNLTGGSTPANAYNYSLERSFSPFDVTHRFVGNALWNLPIGEHGKILNNGGLPSRLIGGWQFNAIVTLETGTPFTVTAPDESATGPNHQSRGNCTGNPYAGASTNPSKIVGTAAPGFYLNPAAFAIPALGTFGNCAPRSFHGPGLENADLSLFKQFLLTERWKLEFRSEFFNAFNHANFTNPNSSISPASIGSFGKVFNTVTDPREIQFALKVYF
ncbi:MAG: TonB-dependent receptor [Acidobacteriaceae bacterium]|nr:TonB-dependent receptor [Acidobacteriaceae bacterium]